MGKTEAISSEIRNATRVSILPTLTQYSFGIPCQSNKNGGKNLKDSKREGRSPIYR
jgi:hypothetical protein